MVVLTTVEEALQFLADIEDQTEVEGVRFSGELERFHLTIGGERYHSSVPGELARGLWQLQEALYSAAAFALTGESDIRKLSAEQRSNFELVFEVKEGSSDFWASLGKFFEGLGEGFVNMDSKHKAVTLVLSAVIVAGGVTAWKALDANAEVKKEEVKAELALQLEEQKTRQFELLARATSGNPVAQKFEQAVTEGTKAVTRGAADAEEVRIGRVVFDSDEIKETNRRSQRTPTTSNVIEENFRVFTVNVREPGIAKYVLAGVETGEFVASLEEQSFSPEEIQRVLDAAQQRRDIRLEVLTTVRKGAIQGAKILQVL
jgi:hypothetical protein